MPGSVGQVLLAEDLLLLLTDDDSGRLSAPADQVDAGLGGATLAELALLEKVDLTGEPDQGRAGRIIVRDPAPAGDPVLDAALAILLGHQGSKPAAVIRPLSRNLRRELYDRLAASGIVRAGEGRVLGVFPAHRWPAQDTRHETELRERLAGVLVEQAAPDPRTAAIIALLHALRCEHKVIDPRQYGLSRRELRARADTVARGDWGSAAVRRAIDEATAAIAAVIAATSAVGSG